jgi:hypothetical protein
LGVDAMPLYGIENLFSHPRQITWQSMDDNVMALIDWEKPCLQD